MQPAISLCIAFILVFPPAVVCAQSPPTDANLITAIDVSGSVDPSAEALQFEGIADAILAPAFLRTVAAGYHRRVGFAAFTWSSHGHFMTLVPWTVIESPATAASVATQLREVRAQPRSFPLAPPSAEQRPWRRDLLTDVSATLEHALVMLAGAPFTAGREVINVLANGPDNVAEAPDTARAWAMDKGVVINGLVLGGKEEVVAYFRGHVQSGPGSFVLATHEPSDIAWAMLQKFLLDLASLDRTGSADGHSQPRPGPGAQLPVTDGLG